jgi:hypothetical protein
VKESYSASSRASTSNRHDTAPIQRLLARLTTNGYEPRPTGSGQWESRCPGHKGQRRNLSIREGNDGTVLIRCHHSDESGQSCSAAAIVGELGLELKDLFAKTPGSPESNGEAKPKSSGSGRNAANGKPAGNLRKASYPSPDAAFLALGLGKPAASWMYQLVDGTETAAVARFDQPGGRKEYRPAHRNQSGWSIGDPPGLWPPYNLREVAGVERLYFFEGEKCCEIGRSLGLKTSTTAHGAQSPHKTDLEPTAGKEIIIILDVGPAGEGYGKALVGLLGRLEPRPRVKILRLPGLERDGDDIEQWVQAHEGWKTDQLRAEIERLAAQEPFIDMGRPEIICGSEDPDEGLKTWTPAAMSALYLANSPPFIFQRPGSLVRMKPAEVDAPPEIEPLSQDALRGVLDRVANWGSAYRTSKGELRIKYGPPRMDVVRDVASLGTWDTGTIPRLDAVVETPRFLPDGRLLTQSGYHADARIFYAPPVGLAGITIPVNPDSEDVRWAKSLLIDDLFCDFPFANAASLANAVALTLLPFVRSMVSGPTPLHHHTAATEGTGKTLLAVACSYPSLGRELNLNPQKEGESEWRKALTSTFMAGHTHFFIDNLNNPPGWDGTPTPIDSGVLALALTAPYYVDRKLGGNEEARIRIQTVFMSSGNNVMFSRELTRRIVPIELVATSENPSMRTGFKHDPLIEGFIQPRRRDLLRACLILCQHWIAQGKPLGKQTMGRYETYARTMGGILDSIEIPGFLDNRSKLIGRNVESTRWPALVAAWHTAHAETMVTSADLWKTIASNQDLHVAFADIVGDKGELSQKQRLGRAIEKQTNQVWGDWRIVRTDIRVRNGSAVYRLKPASEACFETDGEADSDATSNDDSDSDIF